MKINAHGFIYAVLSVMVLVCLCGCGPSEELAEKSWSVMGTFAAVSIPAGEKEHLEDYAGTCRGVLGELENTLSVFKPDSEISRLNRAAGQAPIEVSGSTRTMLELSLKYAGVSEGCFDVTVNPLVRLWGFGKKGVPARLPDEETIQSVLSNVGYRHLVLSDSTVYLDRAGMSVDLGGIAKGYAVDMCYDRLVESGAGDMIINLGGNIRCRGVPGSGRAWIIGVRNPFDSDVLVGRIHLPSGMATATSGNYERFVEIEGRTYAHIIDPRSGLPVSGMAGVTVVSPTAVEADAMSTALFVCGVEDGGKVLGGVPGTEALWIPDSQPVRVFVTRGFMEYFEPAAEFADVIEVLK
jgi:thiamine biosynthesis lipoprotein